MAARKAKKLYRTMQGKMVDIEKLRAANESIRAVGNMNVNARGDMLNRSGSIVQNKAEVMREYYEQPRGAASDVPLKAKPSILPKSAPKTQNQQPVKQFSPAPKENKELQQIYSNPKWKLKLQRLRKLKKVSMRHLTA